MDPFIALNGKIMRASEARVSPFDNGFLYGDGVYETLRTYGGIRVLDFSAHLARLRISAEVMEIPLDVNDEEIKLLTLEVVRKNGFKESRIRISLTRGENGFCFSGAKNPTFMISASELSDYEKYASGVDLVSILMERTEPEIKSISLLPLIIGKQKAEKAGAFDTIFIDHEGTVTEGTVFNILMRNGNEIISADPQTVLPGTAQIFFLDLAKKSGFQIRHKKFGLNELKDADEVIITNSLFGALPVRKIDGIQINNCPGELHERCGKKLIEEMARL